MRTETTPSTDYSKFYPVVAPLVMCILTIVQLALLHNHANASLLSSEVRNLQNHLLAKREALYRVGGQSSGQDSLSSLRLNSREASQSLFAAGMEEAWREGVSCGGSRTLRAIRSITARAVPYRQFALPSAERVQSNPKSRIMPGIEAVQEEHREHAKMQAWETAFRGHEGKTLQESKEGMQGEGCAALHDRQGRACESWSPINRRASGKDRSGTQGEEKTDRDDVRTSRVQPREEKET